ncbi:hypothetical protein [Candidatus Odyssella acanthamoebae]|uniref:Uncharacterized protein n=1 Tax=Candidatus Odyssella acanthamoebae TaxID=91604 RepID=A0A077AZE7_9PROT|nr:hypothetical protein [Candidatus Paracaedibacter acanthamoebae]AIK97053.1 hypothetical protein ID47_10405 [Candidatus Paracaedibacter acanthamoebae]
MRYSLAFLMSLLISSQSTALAMEKEADAGLFTAQDVSAQKFVTVYHAQGIDGIFLSSVIEVLDPHKEKLHYLRSDEYVLDESVTAASFLEMPEFKNGKGVNDINAWKRQRVICVSFN